MNNEAHHIERTLPFMDCEQQDGRPERILGFTVNDMRFKDFASAEDYALSISSEYEMSTSVEDYIRALRSHVKHRQEHERKFEELARRKGFASGADYLSHKHAAAGHQSSKRPAVEFYGAARPSDLTSEAAQ